jgi:tRNA-specific 2-thiouridylase
MNPSGAAQEGRATRVLVAMSGGVDSSVAAARLVALGHEVVGVTLKLWGGPSDQGCCSVSDVDDARRVADRLGIEHHVFNFTADFDAWVVDPYLAAHQRGETPNPCVACNRHLKFDRLTERAWALGFDAVATGHHARVVRGGAGYRLHRAADGAKDQSYVLYMLDQKVLSRLLLPVGDSTKAELRAEAAALGLRTAAKPDSQDVCFIGRSVGRAAFLGTRMALRPGRIVDGDGAEVGTVEAVELVTIGQRRGLGLSGSDTPRFVTDVDLATATVRVGTAVDLLRPTVTLRDLRWACAAHSGPVLAQISAHGVAHPASIEGDLLRWAVPQRRVAPGQAVVLYDGDEVVGGGLAC